MVERGHCDRGVERCGWFVQLVQRDGTNFCPGGFRVDCEHLVAAVGKRSGERTVARADLEQAHRRCGQVRADEGQ